MQGPVVFARDVCLTGNVVIINPARTSRTLRAGWYHTWVGLGLTLTLTVTLTLTLTVTVTLTLTLAALLTGLPTRRRRLPSAAASARRPARPRSAQRAAYRPQRAA